MCRRTKKACALLGSDPFDWSVFEPLPAIDAVVHGFAHFEDAIRSAAEGKIERARAALLRVEGAAIQEWYIEHAQVSGSRRFALLGGKSRSDSDVERDRLPYPGAKLEAEVFAVDGFRCRYCKRPVVTRELLKAFHSVVGNGSFAMGSTNASTHGAALAYRAVADHVIPRKRGGRTDRGNLVTACYPCNFGKAEYGLEELHLQAPRPAFLDGWDGLQSLIPMLKRQADVAKQA